MARIPVAQVPVQTHREDDDDRRRGLPLWVWPLIPLLLGALALGLAAQRDDRAARTEAPATSRTNQGATNTNQGATNAGQAATGAALTDMLAVLNDQNPASFAGREASFANVQVQSVPGDRGFWIGPSAEQQLFVVIDEANAGLSEGQIQVAQGQAVTINGVLEQLPPARQIPAEWGYAPLANGATSPPVYLHAREISTGQ